MKKFLTFALVCCLVFSSSSTVFATATQWDTSDQANLRYIYQSVTSGGSLYTLVNNIYTRVNTISNTLTDIKGYLYHNNHSIAYWVEAINSWMSPIYGRLADIITNTLNIEAVAGLLGSTEVVNGTTVRTSYLQYNGKSVAQLLSENKDFFDLKYGYFGPNDNNPSGAGTWVGLWGLNGDGSMSSKSAYFRNSNLLGVLPWYLNLITNNTAIHGNIDGQNWTHLKNNILGGYTRPNNYTDWLTNTAQSFTVDTFPTMLATWLMNIQKPVARLSYVLASEERIEAQEKAADNEQAVVDNFIDSSGSGAATTSDFGSVSDLSSGFKNNISTDASVSGIWNIFNSDNFGWFSQETANQLDTTDSGTRTLRSYGSYPTPLLDKQTEDIMNILGGDDND